MRSRQIQHRRRRIWLGLLIAVATAGSTGFYLGFRANRTSEELINERRAEQRGGDAPDITGETNRILFKLWEMEDLERAGGARTTVTDSDQRTGWRSLISRAPASARVLIVDDDHHVRKSLERLVTSLGHEVRAAASAEEADHWLGAERFEAMFLDVELPRMKGVEFLSWALDRDPQLAILMLTGSTILTSLSSVWNRAPALSS